MDKILEFLSDYYIWFFVAAGVLVFALIGFAVISKKKQKESEFKGESINATPESNVTPAETMSAAPVGEPAPVNYSEPIPSNPIESSNPVSQVEPVSEPEEVVINDIPMDEQHENTERIEFLNEIPNVQAPTEPTLDEIKPIHEFNSFSNENEKVDNLYDEPIIPESNNRDYYNNNNNNVE